MKVDGGKLMFTEVDGKEIKLAEFYNMNASPKGLKFRTQNDDFIQAASFNYDKGHIMRPHRHIERTPPEFFRTEEVLLVWRGRVKCTIYDIDGFTREPEIMEAGDYVIIYHGGVSYEVLEDNTIMLEVKSGPFTTSEEDRILL